MRLFIALDCSEVKDVVTSVQSQLPKERLSFSKDCHVTLKFLGEVPEENVDHIKQKLSQISFTPFSFSLDSIDYFKHKGRISVVWIGVKPQDQIIELHKKIDSVLSEYSLDHRFSPHLTVARVKYVENTREFITKIKKIKIEKKEITVEKFHVMKSVLTPKGPEYSVIDSF